MSAVSFLAIQALGLVPSIVCFTSLQSGSRLRILRLQMVCSVLWACHYGLLGGLHGGSDQRRWVVSGRSLLP